MWWIRTGVKSLPPVVGASSATCIVVSAVAAGAGWAGPMATATVVVAGPVSTATTAVATTVLHTIIARAKVSFVSSAARLSASERPRFHGQGLQPLREFLIRLHNEFDQIFGQVSVLVIEERRGQAQVAHSAGSSDAVNVLLDVRGHVEVDDVLDVWNVESSCSNLETTTTPTFDTANVIYV